MFRPIYTVRLLSTLITRCDCTVENTMKRDQCCAIVYILTTEETTRKEDLQATSIALPGQRYFDSEAEAFEEKPVAAVGIHQPMRFLFLQYPRLLTAASVDLSSLQCR